MELWIAKIKPIFDKHAVAAAYLFGSRTSDKIRIQSDFDLAILFASYHSKKHGIQLRMLLREEISAVLKEQVDLLFLQSAPVVMQFEVISTGKVVYCVDDNFRTDFEDIVFRDYLDIKPFLDQYYKEEMEAVRDGYFFAEH